MNYRFEGQVALVTGAGMGIGRACALAYAREGARVVLADIVETAAQETVQAIREAGGEALFVRCDVSRADEVEAMVAAAVRQFGRLDCACNNAGIGGPALLTADYSEADWNRVIGINLTGAWLCMKHEIRALLAQGGGAIVNMASILGTVGFATAPAYVAAKHGLIGLTRTAALEYATQGVRVNAVCPGFIETPLLASSGITPGSDLYAGIANMHPVKRLGTPEEVAELVVWLSSAAASFVTGAAYLVDGGYTAQ
jgi:NAD(P)-dependent dehydrogenase (short-subunit alcohol dehydrogenase family)